MMSGGVMRVPKDAMKVPDGVIVDVSVVCITNILVFSPVLYFIFFLL